LSSSRRISPMESWRLIVGLNGTVSNKHVHFCKGLQTFLGIAIERQRMEQSPRAAVKRDQLLLKEVNHRVNNSLAPGISMLHLKSATANAEVKVHLDEA